MEERNLLVGQSGGPTVAINSSLAGVISCALKRDEIHKIYGARNGISGLLKEELVELSQVFKGEEGLDQLKYTPSMYLGSCRHKLKPFDQDQETYHKIFQLFLKYNIKYFLYIGGNDSMDTVDKLSCYAESQNYDIKIMGIPKTIDNDLMEIDHTPGFGSAAKFIATSILEMAHDTSIYNMESVLIVEIMGRNAGWLTAASVLARTTYSSAPHLIYLPEYSFSTARFVQDVKEQLKQRKQVIVAVSEGIKDKEGIYISSRSMDQDQFGHVMLSGTGKYLENLIKDTIGCKVRSIELNVLQRCASHLSSETDLSEAFLLGEKGVSFVLEGKNSQMVTMKRVSSQPYAIEIDTVAVNQVANFERKIPLKWISEDGNNVTEEMREYLMPLIVGETKIPYLNGIPQYIFCKEKSEI
ncbi:6-phosphofructokinase [Anaeromicropila populeti]|uniref:Pyrophosphate--fructose 6-phosphate 1-phosphotransferase n=1 Tax=Anaeromicropila populeti TaxID=37658 RepID=A0A1I6K0B6_9FIRM|nr:6-phosphofructokinase [Anaeromicropila populeti]SFR84250.1 6-phosphofructokinase 1 [Anaeromicropila populeti]